MPVKKENKLHQIYSSSMFEDSNIDNIDNINNNKREIKYCNSNSFKTYSEINEQYLNIMQDISDLKYDKFIDFNEISP